MNPHASPPQQMERENEMIVISHRLFSHPQISEVGYLRRIA